VKIGVADEGELIAGAGLEGGGHGCQWQWRRSPPMHLM
jgi:hypothetical protein